MSGSALMTSHQVNLDEFEQRLRMAGSPVGPQEDPLEELARLVGAEVREPAAKLFSAPPAAKVAPMRLPQAPVLRVPPRVEENETAEEPAAEPGMLDEVSLRGALDDLFPARDVTHHSEEASAESDSDEAPARELAPVRRRSKVAVMGALVAIGAVSG